MPAIPGLFGQPRSWAPLTAPIRVPPRLTYYHYAAHAPRTGQPTDRGELLGDILRRIDMLMPQAYDNGQQPGAAEGLRRKYMSRLYRRRGFHPYVDARGAFMAQIADVGDDGLLTLVDDSATPRHYAFKEVQFVI